MRRRQLILAAAVLLALVLLVLAVRSCQSSARKRAVRDYTTNISNVVRRSDANVSRPLFRLLSGAGAQATGGVALQNRANNLKVEADDQLQRASGLDVPSEADDAQRNVLLALELRRDAVQRIANVLQEVKGRNGEGAVRALAGQMRAFDASDVIWSQRVVPLVIAAQRDADVDPRTNPVARSSFLPDSAWLNPTFVAAQVGAATGGGGGGGKPAPGSHGHGLAAVSAGGTTLSTTSVNRVPATPAPEFSVRVANQGDNVERNVRVRVSGDGIPTATKTLASSPTGQESTVTVALPRSPRVTGSVQSVTVEVLPVPGEETTTNNKQTFQILFTR